MVGGGAVLGHHRSEDTLGDAGPLECDEIVGSSSKTCSAWQLMLWTMSGSPSPALVI